MIRKFLSLAPLLLVIVTDSPAAGQERVTHPRIRAALHELREARNHLKDARDAWPPGQKEQAERGLNAAIKTLRTILAVDNFLSKRHRNIRL